MDNAPEKPQYRVGLTFEQFKILFDEYYKDFKKIYQKCG